MRRSTPLTITITGAVVSAALTAGVVASPLVEPGAPVLAAAAAPATTADPAAARTELAELEREADAAGVAAERADEALLQHRTAQTVAAAGEARSALQRLAAAQAPRLQALAAELGPASRPATAEAATAVKATTRAQKAVSFAKRQIGKPYVYAGSGLRAYDCSGLTMRAYAAVDKGIGGHSATAQYAKAKRQHRLHPYAHARVGDLIFYGSPGAVYHVAIYAGHGRMIEAPYPGRDVREVAVRPAGRLALVARPAA